MQIGFNLPNSGPFSKVNEMTRLAVEGEAMGFDYLTVTDHVVLPDTRVPGYPYSEDGAFYVNWAYSNIGVLLALVIGFVGTLIGGRARIRRQENVA